MPVMKKFAAVLGRTFFHPGGHTMLLIIALLFFALWIASAIASFTLNGLAHLLLIGAIALVLIRLMRGRQRPI
jgi:hypothetical protein